MSPYILVLAQAAHVLVVWCAVARLIARLPSRSNRRHALSQPADDTATPKAPLLQCCSGVPHRPQPSLMQETHAWGGNYWASINLRDGPDYKRNRIKRPARPPLPAAQAASSAAPRATRARAAAAMWQPTHARRLASRRRSKGALALRCT